MNEYELVYIVSPRLSAEEGERATASVDGIIRDSGGELLSTDVWGRRRLAYPIKHHSEGIYIYSTFRVEPSATVRIESQIGLSEDVLRHMIIRGIVEGGKPEAQSARLMASNRPAVAPPPPAVAAAAAEAPAVEAEAPATDEAAGAPTAEAATDVSTEAGAELASAAVEEAPPAPEATATEASAEAASPEAASPEAVSAEAASTEAEASTDAEAPTEVEGTDVPTPAEPEPARAE